MDRARRRWGGSGGGTLIDGDARADARDDAIIALERASSLMLGSPMMLGALVAYDCPDMDIALGVEGRKGSATWLLVDPRDGGKRGGSLGFEAGGTDESRDPKEGWGLESRLS